MGVVGVEDAFYDGQTQARADNAAAVLLVHLVISVPDIGQLVGGDALAVVGHLYPHPLVPDGLGEDNGFVLSGVVDRAVDEVVDYLRDAQLVGVDENVLAALKYDVEAVLLDQL